jgi:hypothetical protein
LEQASLPGSGFALIVCDKPSTVSTTVKHRAASRVLTGIVGVIRFESPDRRPFDEKAWLPRVRGICLSPRCRRVSGPPFSPCSHGNSGLDERVCDNHRRGLSGSLRVIAQVTAKFLVYRLGCRALIRRLGTSIHLAREPAGTVVGKLGQPSCSDSSQGGAVLESFRKVRRHGFEASQIAARLMSYHIDAHMCVGYNAEKIRTSSIHRVAILPKVRGFFSCGVGRHERLVAGAGSGGRSVLEIGSPIGTATGTRGAQARGCHARAN